MTNPTIPLDVETALLVAVLRGRLDHNDLVPIHNRDGTKWWVRLWQYAQDLTYTFDESQPLPEVYNRWWVLNEVSMDTPQQAAVRIQRLR